MSTIIGLGGSSTFDAQKLESLIPLLNKITREYYEVCENLFQQLEVYRLNNPLAATQIEKELDRFLYEWKQKVQKLGARVAGLWTLDFDAVDGFFTWEFPQEKIVQWHHCSKSSSLNYERVDLRSIAEFVQH